jgi:hypothetical protein
MYYPEVKDKNPFVFFVEKPLSDKPLRLLSCKLPDINFLKISPPFEGGVAGQLIIIILQMLIPAGVVDCLIRSRVFIIENFNISVFTNSGS